MAFMKRFEMTTTTECEEKKKRKLIGRSESAFNFEYNKTEWQCWRISNALVPFISKTTGLVAKQIFQPESAFNFEYNIWFKIHDFDLELNGNY
ncbi:hypothetical protein OUZ56_016009 [Daphnia magna]|uniref:Uncharacterized protein n=1 Tax=Daphnia magna TaxID=35525 RepID=A0ABR0APE6_9CRUS|nr:hypothetical protein OUZ56_016009 [Daphnia magna]